MGGRSPSTVTHCIHHGSTFRGIHSKLLQCADYKFLTTPTVHGRKSFHPASGNVTSILMKNNLVDFSGGVSHEGHLRIDDLEKKFRL